MLIKELKLFYNELNKVYSAKDSYTYVISYLLNRINEECGFAERKSFTGSIHIFENEKNIADYCNLNRYDFSKVLKENLLGSIYEEFLDIDIKKDLGLFYTPEAIVDFIMEETLKKAEIINNPFIKILDPSCGSGYFLLKAYDILKDKFLLNLKNLRERYSETLYEISINNKVCNIPGREYWVDKNIHYHIIKHCLFGADIDGFGVNFTRNSLKFKEPSHSSLEPNIVLCNSLVKWEKKSGSHKGFFENKFNYIIGNPPWVSLSRKYSRKVPKGIMNYYKENYKGNNYLPNLYEYFMERSMELIEKGGFIGFVIPDRFAKNLHLAYLRKVILENYNIKNIVYGIKFENVSADSMAIIIENNFSKDNEVEFASLEGEKFTLPQSLMVERSNFEISFRSFKDLEAYEKAMINSKLLKDAATTFTGFIGINKYLSEERVTMEQVPVLKGVNIGKYKIKGNKYYFLSKENIIGGTKDIEKLKTKDKIIVRKTGSTLIAALDKEGYPVEQSLYGIILKDKSFRVKYILAILNSKFMEEYYKDFLITNKNSTPQIKKINLDEIPIKCCNIKKQMYIEELVNKIENCKGCEFEELKDAIDKEISLIYG